ncbi:hypothetical protein OFC63_30540, partial [Escherichia coli]|nr:hypothetical protein [Escherichia coli]
NSQIKNDCSEKLCKISPETAAAIAKGYMCLDYELKEYKVEVLESTDTYEIRFRRVINQHLGIEGPTIFLRKSNGERLYTIHAK